MNATDLNMGHRPHPWLNRMVVDTEHDGRLGVLRAVAPDVDDIRLEPVFRVPALPPVAWLRPKAGGVEWTTPLAAIEEAPDDDDPGATGTTAAGREVIVCTHRPRCPGPESPDRDAAKRVTRDWSTGWSCLCNGVYLFDDTGGLLPDGRLISPRRPVQEAV